MSTLMLGDPTAMADHLTHGTAGADLLRLPVSRVQLRWAEALLAMWHGDLDEAERLIDRAHGLHVQTELYESGVSALARLSLRWVRGDLAATDRELDEVPETWLWRAAATARTGDPAADPLLDDVVPQETPFYWSTLGHQVVLAHAVADAGAVRHAPAMLARLAPFDGFVAAIGQIGVIGTVSLALGRLHALLGDDDAARAAFTASAGLARRADGEPTLLHSRLCGALLDPVGPARDAELADVAARAERLGLAWTASVARAGQGA